MISPVLNTGVCGRFEALEGLDCRIIPAENFFKPTSDLKFKNNNNNNNNHNSKRRIFTKREIYELVFGHCAGCRKMAAVPQGIFAMRKVQEIHQRKIVIMSVERDEGDDKEYRGSGFRKNLTEGRELTPLKYNSKLMNSIWGLYNRYSVHNFKKNTDPEGDVETTVFTAAWGSFFDGQASTGSTSTKVVGNAVKH